MIINILHLYPKNMNLYGDHGNILALKRRLEWRGYEAAAARIRDRLLLRTI